MGCQCSSNGAEDAASVDLKNNKKSDSKANIEKVNLRPTQESKKLDTAYFLNELEIDAVDESPKAGRETFEEEKNMTFIKANLSNKVNDKAYKNLKAPSPTSSFSNEESKVRNEADRFTLRDRKQL